LQFFIINSGKIEKQLLTYSYFIAEQRKRDE
jgi:hypothetical protein